jgi:hypothetical protein
MTGREFVVNLSRFLINLKQYPFERFIKTRDYDGWSESSR